MRLFVSYAGEDAQFVAAMNTALREAGYRVDFTPRMGDSCGADWMERINQATAFIAVLSVPALKFDLCSSERNYALAEKVPLIVVKIGNVKLPEEIRRAPSVDAFYLTASQTAGQIMAELDKLLTPAQRIPDIPELSDEESWQDAEALDDAVAEPTSAAELLDEAPTVTDDQLPDWLGMAEDKEAPPAPAPAVKREASLPAALDALEEERAEDDDAFLEEETMRERPMTPPAPPPIPGEAVPPVGEQIPPEATAGLEEWTNSHTIAPEPEPKGITQEIPPEATAGLEEWPPDPASAPAAQSTSSSTGSTPLVGVDEAIEKARRHYARQQYEEARAALEDVEEDDKVRRWRDRLDQVSGETPGEDGSHYDMPPPAPEPPPLPAQKKGRGFGRSRRGHDIPDVAHRHQELPSVTPEETHPSFSAYYPEKVSAGQSYALLAFAHLEQARDQVQRIAVQYASAMGGSPVNASTLSVRPIRQGELLTFVPFVRGATFSPPEQVVKWYTPFQSASFLFNTSPGLDHDLEGQLLVYQGPLIVGEIPITIRYADKSVKNPLLDHEARISRYDPIFASYSRRDAPVMEYFRKQRATLGLEMLVDIYDLRAGEHWSDRLYEMIEASAVFQLFWSKNSAGSPYVRQEWEYARLFQVKRPRFIQPVWWHSPMPDPPPELAELHFQKVELPSLTRFQLIGARLRHMLGLG
jgi:hypothetical protein